MATFSKRNREDQDRRQWTSNRQRNYCALWLGSTGEDDDDSDRCHHPRRILQEATRIAAMTAMPTTPIATTSDGIVVHSTPSELCDQSAICFARNRSNRRFYVSLLF